jgi:hypothetical protein
MYLEKIQKNSGFENSEFEREREGERERERDPHLCSGSATPQNPPDGGNPSTMYLEKIQKNSEFENSEFEREREGEGGGEREKEDTAV